MKEMIKMIREFHEQVRKQNINAFAASTAFFLFLSIVPMLLLICAIIPYTPLSQANLMKIITDLMPDVVDPLAKSLILEVYGTSIGILSIAAVTTLWSAGKGVLALIRGLNAVNEVEDTRNYFVIRMIASFYTVIILVILVLSLFLMVFGNQLMNLLLYRVPQIRGMIAFLMNFRFLAVWGVLMFLFAAVYAYVPDKKLRFKEQLPGASFSAVGWSIFSWGFSMYVSASGSFTIYGSLSIIVIVMIWLYFCMYILMIGAYINRYLGMKSQE